MTTTHPIYRSLIRLYPREFRSHYGDDLVRHFANLVHDRGRLRAVGRTTVDVLVTLPRYRLESIMPRSLATVSLFATIVLLATGGIVSILIGISYGAFLLVAALALAIIQRGALARAITSPSSSRARRLTISAVLTIVFAATIAVYLWAISDESISNLSLIVLNAVGIPSLIGAVGFLLAGLLTKSRRTDLPTA